MLTMSMRTVTSSRRTEETAAACRWRTVTRSNAAAEQRLALERALAELAEAHVELARRQSLTDALLETVGVGIVSCAADGSGWLRTSAARRMLGLEADTSAPEA